MIGDVAQTGVDTATEAQKRLIAEAVANHNLAEKHAADAIEAMIRAGENLLQLKQSVRRGQWVEWCKQNVPISIYTAAVYMRLAAHAEFIRENGITTQKAATRALRNRGLKTTIRIDDSRYNKERIMLAQRLRSEGLTVRQIADKLCVSKSVAWRLSNPEAVKKDREAQAKYREKLRLERAAINAQKADAQRKLNEREIKAKGGDLAKSYSYVRKALESMQRASEQADSPDARRSIASAMQCVYQAEDLLIWAGRGVYSQKPIAVGVRGDKMRPRKARLGAGAGE